MHFALDVRDKGSIKTNRSAEFMDEGHQWNKVFASCAESNIFCLHGGESNFCLKEGKPEDRATERKEDVATTTAGTVGVLRMFS